ncbi:MAG: inositol monophosphatase, partial [Candidatus Omnitrophica bacterium]|nr:inositol monophosphatase [Candidatus Omnitrophota bacterium]
KRITVSRISDLGDSFLATGFAYGRNRKDKNIGNFRKLLTRSMAIRRAGSAALDLSYVACGRFDGFWEMDLKPWDSAAGYLLVKEAKGMVSKFNGAEYSVHDNNILATNRKIHSKIVSVLKTHVKI